jgi:hypothetical protein
MAKKTLPLFRKGQLVMVIDDGSGPALDPAFIIGVTGYSKKHGWSYHISISGDTLFEDQLRRIKKKEIR